MTTPTFTEFCKEKHYKKRYPEVSLHDALLAYIKWLIDEKHVERINALFLINQLQAINHFIFEWDKKLFFLPKKPLPPRHIFFKSIFNPTLLRNKNELSAAFSQTVTHSNESVHTTTLLSCISVIPAFTAAQKLLTYLDIYSLTDFLEKTTHIFLSVSIYSMILYTTILLIMALLVKIFSGSLIPSNNYYNKIQYGTPNTPNNTTNQFLLVVTFMLISVLTINAMIVIHHNLALLMIIPAIPSIYLTGLSFVNLLSKKHHPGESTLTADPQIFSQNNSSFQLKNDYSPIAFNTKTNTHFFGIEIDRSNETCLDAVGQTILTRYRAEQFEKAEIPVEFHKTVDVELGALRTRLAAG